MNLPSFKLDLSKCNALPNQISKETHKIDTPPAKITDVPSSHSFRDPEHIKDKDKV